MTTTERAAIVQAAVRQHTAERSQTEPLTVARLRAVDTPILQEMRQSARDLGVTARLLEAYGSSLNRPGHAHDLIGEALILLGVESSELLQWLRKGTE